MSYQAPQPQRRSFNKHAVLYPLVALVALGVGGAASGNADVAAPPQPLVAAAPTTTVVNTATVTATGAPATRTVTKRAKARTVTKTLSKTRTVTATAGSGGGGGSGGGAGVYYANCTEARAAGASPLYLGNPGYRPGLDRDGDGVACE